jgi:hypothetical protein
MSATPRARFSGMPSKVIAARSPPAAAVGTELVLDESVEP